jgi:hypothetical protein
MKVLAFILFNMFGPFFICAELDSHGGVLKFFSVLLTIILVVLTNRLFFGFNRKRF